MAVDRPTFHESWHRIAGLKPRLRARVQATRQVFRSVPWHVLRDPATQKFFRVDAAGYRFIGLLDGRRTVDEAWRLTCGQLGDDAPTQGEALFLIGRLHTSNLLEGELPGDADALYTRQRKRQRRETRQTLTNLLFVKIPIWDPDRFLDRALPLLSWTFGPVGIVLWSALLLVAGLSLAGRAEALLDQTQGVLAPENLIYLYASMVAIKLLHELGHGIAAKRFGRAEGDGGEVHTLGVMLLVLMPVPYVDASSAWAFRSKWRRAAVGAAGMYAELGIAAVAAIVWANTATGTVVHALAFNAIFIAGVSTILFNANPLIRFDAYFILSDLTEQPNLMQRAQQRLQFLAKRHLFGVRRAYDPAGSPGEAAGLALYGVAATLYRLVLTVSIVLFVADQLFFLGAVMAVMAVVTMVLLPLGRGLHYLAASPELARTRRRAALATAVPLAVLLLLAGGLPVREHGRAVGVVEPERYRVVRAGYDGFLVGILPSGTPVGPRDRPPARLANTELESRAARLRAELAELRVRHRMALGSETAVALAIARQRDAVAEDLADAQARLALLTRPSPLPGLWTVAGPDLHPGAWLKRGDLLGTVIAGSGLVVRAAADQSLGPRLRDAGIGPGVGVTLRVLGRPDLEQAGTVTAILPGGRRDLPSAALGFAQGGPFLPPPGEEREGVAAEPFFEVRVRPGDPARLRPGQRVVVRLALAEAPLLVQAWHGLRRTVQERFRL